MNGAQNDVTEEKPRHRRNRLRRELYARRAMELRQLNNTVDDTEDASSRGNQLNRERRARRAVEQLQAESGEVPTEDLRSRRNRLNRERRTRRTAEQRQADSAVNSLVHTRIHPTFMCFDTFYLNMF